MATLSGGLEESVEGAHLGAESPAPGTPSKLTEASSLLHSARSTSSNFGSLTTLDAEIERMGTGRFTAVAAFICGLGNAADAVELLAISFIIPNLDDIEADGTAQAILTATVFCGMLVGGLYTGVVSDIIGRKPMLTLSLAVNAIAGAATAAMPSWPLIALCRIIAGVGVGGSIPSVFSLMTEYLPAKDRGYWINVVAFFWMVGTIYTAGLAWVVLGVMHGSWRVYALLCAIPAAAGAVLTFFYLPESPRFEYLQGRLKTVRAILNYMDSFDSTARGVLGAGRLLGKPEVGSAPTASLDAAGMPSAPLMPAEDMDAMWLVEEDASPNGAVLLRPYRQILRVELAAAAGEGPSLGASGTHSGSSDGGEEEGGTLLATSAPSATAPRTVSTSVQPKSDHKAGVVPASASLFGVCRGGCAAQCAASAAGAQALFLPSLRRSTVLLCMVWFGLSFGWYGLNVWIPTLFKAENVNLDIYLDSFVVAAANLPGNIAAAVLMDRVGRKNLMSGSILIASFTALGMAFANSPASVVALASVLNAVSNGGWNALDALSTESFPTRLRTSAMGVLAASGRLGSIAGQFVFGALVHVSIPLLLFCAAGMLLMGAIAGFCLPKETSGEALADDVEELSGRGASRASAAASALANAQRSASAAIE